MKYIFFLGGHDAEMVEIKDILEQNGLSFYNKELSWGAKLSAYQEELKILKNKTPVLIEIYTDISYPKNTIIIDHHDIISGKDKPSSIEQVADLIGLKLTRRQTLIAANDKGHIKGLINAGATNKEIDEIRAFDRKCQGVTREEEINSKEICDKFNSNGDIDVIEVPFIHTSPITDTLYGRYKNLLIITPVDINFYGNGKVIKRLSKTFEEGWYGGNLPDEGFWGIKNGSKREKKRITDLVKAEIL